MGAWIWCAGYASKRLYLFPTVRILFFAPFNNEVPVPLGGLGFKYTIPEEDNPATQVITGEGENTVINYTLTNGTISATLTMDKSKFGVDPDITFDDELDKFQYVDDSYLENNPGTIDNTITIKSKNNNK